MIAGRGVHMPMHVSLAHTQMRMVQTSEAVLSIHASTYGSHLGSCHDVITHVHTAYPAHYVSSIPSSRFLFFSFSVHHAVHQAIVDELTTLLSFKEKQMY